MNNEFLLNDIAHQLALAQQFALLREQQRAANRRYYERNKAERAAYHKQWYEANKERLQEHYRNKQRERRNGTATAGSPDLTDE